MCGIAGRLHVDGRPVEREVLSRMAAALAHRGPDGEGFFEEEGVGLAHRRLAIIDLEGGAQPMADARERAVVTYNGEVFNYRDLRAALEGEGERFATECDTESLVVGYAAWGEKVLPRLDGQFAFAVWDRARKRILLARDPVGIKPLYYCFEDGALTFASELKALEAVLDGLSLDPQALDRYLSYGYIPSPLSIYAEVKKLRPGEMLRLEMKPGARPAVARFTAPEELYAPAGVEGYANAADLHDDLKAAVDSQLMSDVPLGAFLSGGTDSTAVVMEMCGLRSRPDCFTIAYDSDTTDLERSRQAVEILGARLFSKTVERRSVLEELAGVAAQFDEPFCNDSILPTDALCRMTREHVTVALSGDGGDELLGGYTRFFRHLNAFGRPAPVRAAAAAAGWAARLLPLEGGGLRRLQSRSRPAGAQYAAYHLRSSARQRAQLYGAGFLESLGRPAGGGYLAGLHAASVATREEDRIASVDFQSFLPECVLTKVDRLSMRYSLEVRVPVLALNVVRRCFATPSEHKYEREGRRVVGGKRLLKDVLRRGLPDSFVDLKKRGFSSPVRTWMGEAEVKRARDLLCSPEAGRIFDRGRMARYLDRRARGTRARNFLFTLLVLGLWIERRPRVYLGPSGTSLT